MDSSPTAARRNAKYLPVSNDTVAPYSSRQQREFNPPTAALQLIPLSDTYSTADDSTVWSATAARSRRIQVIKYCIYAFNLIFLIVGVVLATTGMWVRTDSRFREFLSERYRNVVQEAFWQAPTLYIFSYILIVLGACMIVVSFFGCCGAIRESGCLLLTYFCLVFILFVSTLSCGIYLVYKKDSIENEVSDALDYMVQHYYQGAGVIQEALDHLQTTFRCCGNVGCDDFRDYRKDVPRSCDIRCDGCRYRMWDALRIGATITSILMAIVLIAQLLAMAMSLYLFCTKRSPIEQYIAHTYYRNPAYIQSQQRMTQPDKKLSEAEYNRRMRYQEMQPVKVHTAPHPSEEDHFYAEYDIVGSTQPPMQMQAQRQFQRPASGHRQPPPTQQRQMYRETYSRSAPPPYHYDPRR
uniref:Tetraspanin n=1 Tax=Plectus sambesii TaxID=2011161 RepID=A0A914VQH8_9BILA